MEIKWEAGLALPQIRARQAQVKKGRLGDDVLEFAIVQHGIHLVHAEEPALHLFIDVELNLPRGRAVFGEDEVGGVVEDGRVGGAAPDAADTLAGVACFFLQLACSRLLRRFARLHQAARWFPGKMTRAETKLTHEEQAPVRRHRQGKHPVQAANGKKITLALVERVLEPLPVNLENYAVSVQGFVEEIPSGERVHLGLSAYLADGRRISTRGTRVALGRSRTGPCSSRFAGDDDDSADLQGGADGQAGVGGQNRSDGDAIL